MAEPQLDSKQRLLMAIYTEYQKDLPDMDSITPETLGLDEDVFTIAFLKLMNEGWINGLQVYESMGQKMPDVWTSNVMMTRDGIDYVESKAEIQRTSSNVEKVKVIGLKAAEWGFDQLKDMAARTLAEIVQGFAGK